jgi:hypothetical protein
MKSTFTSSGPLTEGSECFVPAVVLNIKMKAWVSDHSPTWDQMNPALDSQGIIADTLM